MTLRPPRGTFAALAPVADPPRLQERGRELAAITDAVEAAAAGQGHVLILEGPAGIGKTALLEAARAGARDRGLAVAAAHASELERRHAWGVARQLLEPRLRGMAPAARDALLEGAPALAAPLVWPTAAPSPAPAGEDDFGLLHGLFWLVAALAARRPLLLAVDDVQWADAASGRFLAFLAARIAGEPVLLLAARRPGPPDGALDTAPGAAVLRPAALSVPAGAELLRAPGDGAPVTDAFAAACHDATGGNPLLLERLAAGLRERGIAGTGHEDARAVAADGPFAVAGAVAAVLARLGDGPRRLAQAAAVLGPAPLHTVGRLAAPQDDAGDAADALVRAGLLRDARPLAFVHALVRDAVLEGLSAGERAGLHRRAADLLARDGAAPEAVAVHLLEAEPAGDPAVAATLAHAGRRALASGAVAEAAAALERALAEPAPPAERPALLLDLARAEHAIGRATAPQRALAAHAAATSPQERAHAAVTLFRVSGPATLDPHEAFELIEAALAGLDGPDGVGAAGRDLALRLQAMRFLAGFLDPALMRRVLEEPEPPELPGGDTPAECAALLHVAARRFLLGGSAAAVTEAVERAVATPDLLFEAAADSYWLELAIGALFKADRLDAARRTVDAALAHAQRRGSAPGFASASAWQAWIALRAGDAAAAEADARAAHDAVPRDAWQRVPCASALIDVLIERNALDEAQAILQAETVNGEIPAQPGMEILQSTRAILRLAQGDAAGALADQQDLRRRDGGLPAHDPDFSGWLRTVRALHATGDPAAAAEQLDAALAWATTWGAPGPLGEARTVEGLLTGGDAGLERLEDAVALLERSPARRELARSLVELGAARRRRGDRVAARPPLRRALDLATAGGLTATADRAREELRVTGAKVRRPAASGPGALTPSERRIAGLAAGGASNPQIAQALFVTVKTVEMHLGHAYRKLDIRSRGELARALGSA